MPRDLNPSGPAPGDELPPGPSDADRIEAFLSSKELVPGYVRNNLAFNRYDARLFADLVASDDALSAIARRAGASPAGEEPAAGVPRTFAGLLFDLFLMYFKFVPELVPDGETDPAFLNANRPLLARLMEEEETMIARLATATDETASALATAEAARKLLDEISRRPDLADWMDRQAPQPRDPSGPQDPTDTAAPAPSDAGGAGDVAPHGPARLGPATPDPPPAADLGATAKGAAESASREAERHAGALASWGLKPADLSRVPLGERLDLARRLRTKRVRDLADLLGRMKNQRASQRRNKVRANRDEIHGVGTSGDVSRVLPGELASAFGGDALGPTAKHRRLDFFRRLSERSVPSYSLRTAEPVGRGPVVALVDASYTMTGEPMAWASAVALTLAQAAARSARGGPPAGARLVSAVFFNRRIVLELRIAAGERDPRKFLSIATVDASGGTDYDAPLRRALEIVEGSHDTARSKQRPRSDADVLLVTDGQCELSERFAPEFARRKHEAGCALVCVLVGPNARPGALEPHAETMVHARDLARASGGRDAAARVFDAL